MVLLTVATLVLDVFSDAICEVVLFRQGLDIGRLDRRRRLIHTACDVTIAAAFGSFGLAMTDNCLYGGLFLMQREGTLKLDYTMQIGYHTKNTLLSPQAHFIAISR